MRVIEIVWVSIGDSRWGGIDKKTRKVNKVGRKVISMETVNMVKNMRTNLKICIVYESSINFVLSSQSKKDCCSHFRTNAVAITFALTPFRSFSVHFFFTPAMFKGAR